MNLRYKISFCLHVSRAAKTHMMLIFLNVGSAQHFSPQNNDNREEKKKRESNMPVFEQSYIWAVWLVTSAVLYIHLAWDVCVSLPDPFPMQAWVKTVYSQGLTPVTAGICVRALCPLLGNLAEYLAGAFSWWWPQAHIHIASLLCIGGGTVMEI